jgi:hypothetical protein
MTRLQDSPKLAGFDGLQSETLAKRLSQGPLPLGYALRYATDVANSLRGLHEEGRTHGSVNANSVIVTADGALLLPPNGQARYTVAGADVSAFGALLHEMLTGSKSSTGSTPPLPATASNNAEKSLEIAATRLASKCLRSTSNSSSEMQNVLTEVRLLSVQARTREKPASAELAAEVSQPEVRRLFPANSKLQTDGPFRSGAADKSGMVEPVFTPVPADGFLTPKDAKPIDPAPSGVKCPSCGVPYVYPSRTRSWFETALAAWGKPPLRCHRCFYRYVAIGRLTFAKGSESNRY